MSFGGIEGKADSAKICECLGCCDPGANGKGYCFFPFYEQNS